MEALIKKELQREFSDHFGKLTDEVKNAFCIDVYENLITFLHNIACENKYAIETKVIFGQAFIKRQTGDALFRIL